MVDDPAQAPGVHSCLRRLRSGDRRCYGPDECRPPLGDAGIVRNRLKVAAAISNAQAFLETREAFGSFDVYIWRFAPDARGPRPRSLGTSRRRRQNPTP